MRTGSCRRAGLAVTAVASLGLFGAGCSARGHIATPEEIGSLQRAEGLSASGRLTVSGPNGKLSTRVIFGVARPDFLRIEIPAGTGLRFLLVSRQGTLRADLPGDDAMFVGPGTKEVVNSLFGIDIEPADLVSAILGTPPKSLTAGWRFGDSLPTQVTIRGSNSTKLILNLDEPLLESPDGRAFDFGPPRAHSWTMEEMSTRLGLRR